MFKHQEIWLPDGEKHFQEWMTRNGELVNGKGTYQIKKFRAAMKHVRPQPRVAVDVGAHVGLWAMQMVKHFDTVHAFEPVAEFRACFERNVPLTAILYPVALGAERGKIAMKIPQLNGGLDTGGTHVGGKGEIDMLPLDEFDFSDIDFIKIDCEGYEHHVLAGARETLTRCRPVVIVEQKPHKLGPNFGIKGTPAVDLLKGMGAKVVQEIGGDFIMVFD